MKTDDPFEQLLSQQPIRPVPADWRESILATAHQVRPLAQASSLVTLWSVLKQLFWPSPRFAMALGVAWALILSLNYLSLPSGDGSERPASATASPIVRMAWLEQQRMRQELLGEEVRDPGVPAPRSRPGIRPRSARAIQIMAC